MTSTGAPQKRSFTVRVTGDVRPTLQAAWRAAEALGLAQRAHSVSRRVYRLEVDGDDDAVDSFARYLQRVRDDLAEHPAPTTSHERRELQGGKRSWARAVAALTRSWARRV